MINGVVNVAPNNPKGSKYLSGSICGRLLRVLAPTYAQYLFVNQYLYVSSSTYRFIYTHSAAGVYAIYMYIKRYQHVTPQNINVMKIKN